MKEIQSFAQTLIDNVEKVIIGKRPNLEQLVVSLLCEGHTLLEDVPGVGKTMLARAFAVSLGIQFKRLQCTPDLLPNDVTGVSIFDQQKQGFTFVPGPVFSNILLADEINRATPRTQSALLEAMGERQVTVDGVTHELERPFFVLATQNPVEYEGTFPLPEAQLDRFFMKLSLGYLDEASESQMLLNLGRAHPIESLTQVVDGHELPKLARQVWDVHVDDTVRDYIVRLTFATRRHKDLILGASPRGSHALYRGIQAYAAVQGRDYTLPDDVKKLAPAILSHRCLIHPESALRGHTNSGILKEIMAATPLDIGELE
ncbi:MAG: MoxR family ATPase [Ardenticatenaceae bacterium]|nr:MoxR family ATPase [Anaerolineales bacterium]MCB8941710.1 MoxR family ATPase [Ardenticatenaceae bacterium]MCB8972821.1 MoxR family ATPase [Ardenticatenaceae bacterium]